MNVEKTLVEMHGMLVKIMDKQEEHSKTLNEHSEILNEHSKILHEHGEILNEHSKILHEHGEILNEHSKILHEHGEILNEHSKILHEHGEILNEHGEMLGAHGQLLESHSSQLKEHGQILNALRTGQEYLKAELDGMKIPDANEFDISKDKHESLTINQELLRNELWATRVDVERIKKTMGMA